MATKKKSDSCDVPKLALGSSVCSFDELDPDFEFLRTGIPQIDYTLGGLCCGAMYHLAGPFGVGKTTFAIQQAVGVLKYLPEDTFVGFIDAERKLNRRMVRNIFEAAGVDISRFKYASTWCGEDAFKVMRHWIHDPRVVAIFVDSAKALIPKSDMLKTPDENLQQQGAQKLLHENITKMVPEISGTSTHLTFLDHLKDFKDPGQWSKQWKTTTGFAIRFYCASIMFLLPAGNIAKTVKGKKVSIGCKMKLVTQKSSICGNRSIEGLKCIYGRGISTLSWYIDKASEYGYLELETKTTGEGYKKKTRITKASLITKTTRKVIAETNGQLKKWIEGSGATAWGKICGIIERKEKALFEQSLVTMPGLVDEDFIL